MTTSDDGIDRMILVLDRALRTLAGNVQAQRPNPGAGVAEVPLDAEEKRHAAGLMRINHTGEVCAQALYEGQALVARSPAVRAWLENAAREETDHLVWCNARLKELGSSPSVLNPLFYGASMGLGVVTGLLGDRISLGFVEATEDQVGEHLQDHLGKLPSADERSRAIVSVMREEELAHGNGALTRGGEPFPKPVRNVMRLLSKAMTASTYRI
jgi:ubiquinone biosynthesis monooxygenase Coq7